MPAPQIRRTPLWYEDRARETAADPEAMSETKTPFGTVSARIEERILQPLRAGAFARRTWFSVTVAVVMTVYAGLIGWMLWRDAADPPRGAEAQETPIEVVAEIPKPPTPTAPSPKQEIEKPASSAPRAMNDSKDDSEHSDKDTHAPRSPAPPAEAEPKPTPDDAKDQAEAPAKEAPVTTEAKLEAPKPPDPLDKDAEALDKLPPPEPPKRPETLAQAKKPSPPKPPHRPKTVAQQLAGNSDLPDYTFAKPMRKKARISGGNEDDRYLAVVYGLITQNRHPIRVPYGDWAVAVSFVVDGGGKLVHVEVTRSSGYREVDDQAIESVEAAAPFPPPPSGNTTSMVARLRSLETMAGDR